MIDDHYDQIREFNVVPSTYNQENLRNFGLVVSVKDREVGARGADIAIEALTTGRRLETFPVGRPQFHTWIHCPTVNRRGIRLVPTAAQVSRLIFFPEDDTSCLPTATPSNGPDDVLPPLLRAAASAAVPSP